MSGILGGIVTALGAANQGNVQADQERVKSALQQAQITRQQQQDQIAAAVRERQAQSSLLQDRLTQAQIGDTEAQSRQRQYEFEHPKPIKPNYAPPVIGPNGEVQLINYDDPTHPVKVPGVQGKVEHIPQGPRDQMQLIQTPGTDGNPVYYRVNMTTGEKTPLDLAAVPKAGAAGAHGSGTISPETMNSMFDQAAQADKVMRDFEEKYRAGGQSLGSMDQALGAGAYQHQTGLVSGLSAAASNAGLSLMNKDYQTYLAAQKRFGNIMGNLMSRRYSEYQGALDTQLAGLASGDADNTINLKQSYRDELLKGRPHGGTAPPATGGHSGAPVTNGNPTPARPPLHDRVQQLKAQGLSKGQAKAQLVSEGYSL